MEPLGRGERSHLHFSDLQFPGEDATWRPPLPGHVPGGLRRGAPRPSGVTAKFAARTSTREAPSMICALPAAAEAVPAARRIVGAVLAAWGVGEQVIADAELIASELTTYAVVHGAAPIELRLYQIGDDLAVAVADAYDDTPERVSIRGMPAGGEHPLGLRVVSEIAAAWSISRHPAGHAKRVTALLRADPA